MVVADNVKSDTVYWCPYFTCEEKGPFEPASTLVADQVKAPSDALALRLKEFLKAQLTDAYSKQAAATVAILGSVFSYDQSGLFVRESAVDIAFEK